VSGVAAAIVGSGNIGTDLAIKLQRSESVDLRWMIGIDPASEGLRLAGEMGVETSHEGVDWLLAQDELPRIVFDATSAYAMRENAPRYREAGIKVVDLTPAALGPLVVPVVNLDAHLDADNVNLISCGGQATIPIVAAVAETVEVSYGEIISSVSSASAGPGTRANIDEFTATTARGLESVGGAARGRAVVILNPAEPPLLMRNTVFVALDPDADTDAIAESILRMVAAVAEYVPGYRLTAAPQFDEPRPGWGGKGRVTALLEVEGAGDFLPTHAGNLDIMTAAARRVGERFAAAIGAAR
jgi:acetaldehyde dehydrogenase